MSERLNLLTGSLYSTYSVAEVNELLVFIVERLAEQPARPDDPRVVVDVRRRQQ